MSQAIIRDYAKVRSKYWGGGGVGETEGILRALFDSILWVVPLVLWSSFWHLWFYCRLLSCPQIGLPDLRQQQKRAVGPPRAPRSRVSTIWPFHCLPWQTCLSYPDCDVPCLQHTPLLLVLTSRALNVIFTLMKSVMVTWSCLKSLRTSGVHREPRSGSRYSIRISKWLLQSHLTMLKTRNAHVLKWRKTTEVNSWLSSNFWHFNFWHCRLSAF